MSWGPTQIRRVMRVLDSSARTAHVETDAGQAYVKALGNPEGPHILACELVGSRAAEWLGLPTFARAIVSLTESDVLAYSEADAPEIGAAYVTRAERGTTWGGDEGSLHAVENPDAVSGLVALDTWILNCDRYRVRKDETRINMRNVFLSEEGAAKGKFRLVAMDHTHAFSCGSSLLAGKLRRIELIKSSEIFGLFPAFVPLVSSAEIARLAARLAEFSPGDALALTEGIPRERGWSSDVSESMREFLWERARFLGGHLPSIIAASCGWSPVLDFDRNGNG